MHQNTCAMQRKITKPAFRKYVTSRFETLRLFGAATQSSVRLHCNEEHNPVLCATSNVVQLPVSHEPTGNISTLHRAV
jgi:hypothetical protein